jgi:Zn-dependent M28 family amino/carboxypeptidase
MRSTIIILLIALSAFTFKNEHEKTRILYQTDEIAEQKDIISRLTGNTCITDTFRIRDRYNTVNKQLCIKYLSSLLESYCEKVSSQSYSTSGTNVWGVIPSTTKSTEYIIIGAHFDGISGCPGANDNATGVVAVYSVGKYISALTYRNYSTIIVFFDEEERGLVGSRSFAAKIRTDSLKVHSVHTIDQMGWDNDNDRAIELELPSESLKELYLKVASENNLSFPIHITKVGSTDHSAFRRLGYNATGITEEYVNGDTTPHYHKSTDSYLTVNFEYLQSTTSYLEKVFKKILSKD